MNKGVYVLVVVAAAIIIVLLASAPQPEVFGFQGEQGIQTSAAAQIPQALVLAFNALLLGALTYGTNFLFRVIGLDLREYATPLSATLATFLLGLAQGWLNLMDAQYDPIAIMIMNVLVIVLGGAATYAALSRLRPTE